MTEDVRYIIDHMSPLELADLRGRGRVTLTPEQLARADQAHARPLRMWVVRAGDDSTAGTDGPATTDQGQGRERAA